MLGSRGSLADIILGSGRNTWQTYVDSLADTCGSGRHTGFYQRHGILLDIRPGIRVSGRYTGVLVDTCGFW